METKALVKIEDVKEFEKLFKVSIPVVEEIDYYINTLKKSMEYIFIDDKLAAFAELEAFAKDNGYKGAKDYKMSYALPKMKKYILGTIAYDKLQNFDYSKENFRTKDQVKNNEGHFLLSIDFSAANFNAIKSFDEKFPSEFNGSWEELCEHLDIHPTLGKSKSFRQIVFGNTNPKRLQKVQHLKIMELINIFLEDKEFITEEDDIVFISHDEFIIRIPGSELTGGNFVEGVVYKLKQLSKHINMPIHTTTFKLDKIGKDMFLKTVYHPSFSYINTSVPGGGSGPKFLSEGHKTLFGVPGNKFYKYFKTHVLGEDVEERDLYFVSYGEMAIWKEDEDSIDSTFIPDGEMTLEEVEKDYPYYLKKLKDEVPGLNDAQRRKIINLFMSTCNHCHETELPCHCWNDD